MSEIPLFPKKRTSKKPNQANYIKPTTSQSTSNSIKTFYQPPGKKKIATHTLPTATSSNNTTNPSQPALLVHEDNLSSSSSSFDPYQDDVNWHRMGDRAAFDGKSQNDYIKAFIARIHQAIPAYIHHEYLQPNDSICQECQSSHQSLYAIWKCKDCFASHPLCRSCMRKTHILNPFHQIQCWTGTHFRSAALWEVGVYLIIQHHDSQLLEKCPAVQSAISIRDMKEKGSDEEEQVQIALKHYPAAETIDAEGPAGPNKVDDPVLDTPDRGPGAPDGVSYDADVGSDGLRGGNDGADTSGRAKEAAEDAIFDRLIEEEYRKYGLKNLVRGEFFNDLAAGGPSSHLYQSEPDVRQPSGLMRVVHSNGYHRLQVLSCVCHGDTGNFADSVAAGFMPASFTRVHTLVTRRFLDFARLATLELRASVLQIHQSLLRQTQPLSYLIAEDLYHVLRRMIRIDRWMKKLKWAGYAHSGKDPLQPAPGELGLFCSTCPQPGINLPPNWQQDKNQERYGRTFVADGNFKADHVASATRAEEIPLYDGGGMMPHDETYRAHLAAASETRTQAPCENTFRAIESAMTSSKACDLTGIVGIACARHGMFCPNGIVDLYRGEQQKNVDFAFVQALVRTNVDVGQRVTLMYDIACQYSVHLRARIDRMLEDAGLESLIIDKAIGLFHVHAHKDKCFYRFSPSFIPNLGMVDGEILEPNWALLNKTTRGARTATKVGRAEIIDDIATDVNYKRIIKMPDTLVTKHALAREMSKVHEEIFEQVSLKCAAYKEDWKAAIEAAEATRMTNLAVMDIYGADSIKVGVERPAAGQPAQKTNLQKYIDLALVVESTQQEIEFTKQKMGSNPTETQSEDLELARENLRVLFSQLRLLEAAAALPYISTPILTPPEIRSRPESETIFLPSYNNIDKMHNSIEIQCRVEFLAAQLNAIRDLVVERSLQYTHVKTKASTKAVMTRSRGKAQVLTDEVNLQRRLYNVSRARLLALGPGEQILQTFQILEQADIQPSGLLVAGNSKESLQVAVSLSWLWRGRMIARMPSAVAAAEQNSNDPIATKEFLRVHWLRARALHQRWKEELDLVTHEMRWTVNFYRFKARAWRVAAAQTNTSKQAGAYAMRKHHAWLRLAVHGDLLFKQNNVDYLIIA